MQQTPDTQEVSEYSSIPHYRMHIPENAKILALCDEALVDGVHKRTLVGLVTTPMAPCGDHILSRAAFMFGRINKKTVF